MVDTNTITKSESESNDKSEQDKKSTPAQKTYMPITRKEFEALQDKVAAIQEELKTCVHAHK